MPSHAERHLPVMADVVGLAGVSHQTVSRVVDGHPESERRHGPVSCKPATPSTNAAT